MLKPTLITIFFVNFSLTSFAQFGVNKLGVGVNLVYTTSAQIFLNPNSSNIEIRNKSYTLENIWNPGLDIRYRFANEFIVGFNVEYIERTAEAPNLTAFIGNQVVVLDVEDGFSVVPIELTFYYYFPFSTEDFKFMMGGGLGYYYGQFVRKFNEVQIEVVHRNFALGIQVSASMDYIIYKNFSARLEMKFRDPQYNVKSKYSKSEVSYQGNTIQLPVDALKTKLRLMA